VTDEPRVRGLPSIDQAREARGKLRFPPAKFWAYTALVLTACWILHWKWSQGELESERTKLMARQRAVVKELGPRWYPLRDRIERWTLDLAKEAGPEVVDHDALKGWDFRDRAGIYVRLPVGQATSAESIRKGAKESLRDAFTSCLMRVPNPNAMAGQECQHTRDCPAGELCNETDHCSRPAQPYNLRVAYRTMYVLSDEWVRDAQDAGDDLRLRLLVAGFDDTVRDDLPLAADLLTRAQYFLVVLDEALPDGPPPATQAAVEALQGEAHTARVAVYRLTDDKLVLRVRREAGGELIGGTPSVDAEVMAARQRQANSCALALAVRKATGDETVP
jgi:hypothetical protein